MSVLESIRKRAGLFVVLFVGFALLAFILGDAFRNGSVFSGNDANDLGSINGKSLKRSDYQYEIDNIEAKFIERSGQSSVDPQYHEQVMNGVWNTYLDKYLYSPEYKAVGVAVSPAELTDMLWGRNVSPQITGIPLFQDSLTRQFKPEMVKQFVENLSEDDEEGAATGGVTYADWVEFEDQLVANRKREKYNNVVAKGFYVPAAEAKRNFDFQNKNAIVKYVAKRFDSVADSTIKVSEEDIKKAYEENKFRFRINKTQRRIELVTFDITPSTEDIANAKKAADNVVTGFAAAANDTAYVQANSDNLGQQSFQALIKGQTPTPYDSALYSASAGTVLGPYLENGAYKIIKVIGRSDSAQVKARHILFSKDKYSIAEAKVKADSVLKAIRSGAVDFATAARSISDDPGSGQNGGDLGFFERSRMVKPFADACFNGKVGDMPIVESQFGVHLIEIQQRETPLLTASVEKKITAGSKTINDVYVTATEFAANNTTAEAFEKTAKAKNFAVRNYSVFDGDKSVAGIPNSKELAIWIQDEAKAGSVSRAIQFDDKYVVACLKEVRKKGIPEFEDVKSEAEVLAKQAAKANKFVTEMQGALSGSTTIDQVATKAKATAEGSSLTFNATYMPGAGREPELIGTITTMKAGQMSKVIKGQNGVYVVYVESINELTPAASYNATAVKQQYVNLLRQRAGSEVNTVLEDKAEIKDYRYRYY